MAGNPYLKLSRRERQIMDILYQLEEATAKEVQEQLPDRLSNAAVRTKLRVLEEKGCVTHEQDGPRFVFKPVLAKKAAERSLWEHILDTFYEGSVEKAVTALLSLKRGKVDEQELDRLAELINQEGERGDGQ